MSATVNEAPAGSLARGPGVYLQERLPPARPSPLPTGVPVFAGFVDPAGPAPGGRADGRVRQAVLDRPEALEAQVGAPWPQGYLGHAVRGFFGNGGRRCAAVAVPRRAGDDAAALLAALCAPLAAHGLLEDLGEVDLVCVPDAMALPADGLPQAVAAVQRAVLRHCARMGERFAILDCLPAAADAARTERGYVEQAGALFDASVLPAEPDAGPVEAAAGALYGPWLRVGPGVRAVPPCGHVAGAFARSDAAAGPHASPANVELRGALDLEIDLPGPHCARLNDAGVDCLRALPTRGVRICGARTLAAAGAGAGARYVGGSRLLRALARWLQRDLADLVFEPGGPALWERVRRRVASHCHALHARGALAGDDAAEAFFVRCDAETNPPAARDDGRLVCEIGLALLAPAEFVVVRVTRGGEAMSVSAA